MKINIAKQDLWWARHAMEIAIDHIERCPNPSAFSKTPDVAKRMYKKLSDAMPGYDRRSHYLPSTITKPK